MALQPLRLKVLVQPRARRTQIVGRHEDGLKVQVNAPPVDGAANDAVIELLAAALRLPQRSLHIVQGANRRQKLIEVDGADAACRQRLEALLQTVDKGAPRR